MEPQASRMSAPLIGFRIFRERDGELFSLTSLPAGRERWPAIGVVDADCQGSAVQGQVPHLAPAAGCTCGAYAVDSLATLRRCRTHFWFWHLQGNVVTAAVQVWSSPGRPVIVGELRGAPGYQYRAPYMRVLALAASPAARRVAKRHGVLVLPAAGLELYAREHGRQMRPAAPDRASGDAAVSVVLPGWLRWASERRARSRARWAWTLALAGALTLQASGRLTAFGLWCSLRWLLPRLGRVAVYTVLNPVQALMAAVFWFVLLATPLALLGWARHPGS